MGRRHILEKMWSATKQYFFGPSFRHSIPLAVSIKHIAAVRARGRREFHKTGTDPLLWSVPG